MNVVMLPLKLVNADGYREILAVRALLLRRNTHEEAGALHTRRW